MSIDNVGIYNNFEPPETISTQLLRFEEKEA